MRARVKPREHCIHGAISGMGEHMLGFRYGGIATGYMRRVCAMRIALSKIYNKIRGCVCHSLERTSRSFDVKLIQSDSGVEKGTYR